MADDFYAEPGWQTLITVLGKFVDEELADETNGDFVISAEDLQYKLFHTVWEWPDLVDTDYISDLEDDFSDELDSTKKALWQAMQPFIKDKAPEGQSSEELAKLVYEEVLDWRSWYYALVSDTSLDWLDDEIYGGDYADDEGNSQGY